jgi:hypothetical protein
MLAAATSHYYAAADFAMIFTRFFAATPPRARLRRHAPCREILPPRRHFADAPAAAAALPYGAVRLFFMPQRRRRRERLPQALPRRCYAAGLRIFRAAPLTLFRAASAFLAPRRRLLPPLFRHAIFRAFFFLFVFFDADDTLRRRLPLHFILR